MSISVGFFWIKKFPWNPEIYLAQQGDTKAMRRTCAKAEPIVDQFGKVSYFVNLLGKDEVRSIASLSLVEFVMSYPGGVPDEEVPALIKQAIKCDLINSVHRLEYRRGKEEAPPTNADTGSPENSSGDTGSPSAPLTGSRKPACYRTHMPKRYRTPFSTWTGTSRPSSSFIISARKPPMRLQSG